MQKYSSSSNLSLDHLVGWPAEPVSWLRVIFCCCFMSLYFDLLIILFSASLLLYCPSFWLKKKALNWYFQVVSLKASWNSKSCCYSLYSSRVQWCPQTSLCNHQYLISTATLLAKLHSQHLPKPIIQISQNWRGQMSNRKQTGKTSNSEWQSLTTLSSRHQITICRLAVAFKTLTNKLGFCFPRQESAYSIHSLLLPLPTLTGFQFLKNNH